MTESPRADLTGVRAPPRLASKHRVSRTRNKRNELGEAVHEPLDVTQPLLTAEFLHG